MNKIILFFLSLFLACFTTSVRAEVFKCVVGDKTLYQPDPCPATAVKQAEIAIEKPDPAKTAEAEAKLKAWENDFAKREAEERQAQKERQAELDKQAELDALKRSARAQEELAEEARNPIIINRPYVVNPYFSPYHRPGGFGHDFPYRFGNDHQPQQPPNKQPRHYELSPHSR